MFLLCLSNMHTSSCIDMIPFSLSVMLSICIWNTSCDILRPNGILRKQYLPLWVLKVVRYEEGVSKCILQNPIFASRLENIVPPDSWCEICSNEGAL